MNALMTDLTQFLSENTLASPRFGLLMAALFCLTALLAFLGISSSLRYRRAHQDVRRKAEGNWEPAESQQMTASDSPVREGFFQWLTLLGKSAKPRNEEELSRIRASLVKAGYRGADAPLVFLGAKLFLALLLPCIYTLLRPFTMGTLPYSSTMLLFLFMAIVGFYAPNGWLQMKIRRRKRQLFEAFPDALDLMVVCVEAGLGLDAAIHRVGRDMKLSHKVLYEEFALVNLGLRAGQTRQSALRNLSLRTGLEEVNNFVTLLIQTEQFGTSIVQALKVHADAMRTKRYQKAEELAMKIPIKILFPLILFILPSLLVVIVGPAVVRIIRVLMPMLTGG